MVKSNYCPVCDKEVETIEVSTGTRGEGLSLRCVECGRMIADLEAKQTEGNVEAHQARVIIAGYTDVQNDLLIAALIRSRYADSVKSCSNGEEFLSLMTTMLHKKDRPKLIILEVQMSIMNGINSALCMRSIEKGVNSEKAPILFFTQKPLDDSFTRAIKFLTPAKYIPLPSDADAESFKAQADKVTDLLQQADW